MSFAAWFLFLFSVYLGDLPLENPDLFGGDILGIEDVHVMYPRKFYHIVFFIDV